VEYIKIVFKWISSEPEYLKDPKGSGLLGDGSKLRKSEGGGELMVPTGFSVLTNIRQLEMNNYLSWRDGDGSGVD
jgi:hypothetical protein